MSENLPAIQVVRGQLTAMKGEIKAGLPEHVSPDRFIRVAMTAINSNQSLLEKDRHSLYGSIMKCASDGLIPDGNEAALVPFGNKVQYMPMVAGILKKVRNSGELLSITSLVVHKNDHFKFHVDSDGEHLEHEPLTFGDRGHPIGVYALAKTKDGATYIETMSEDEVLKVAKVSRSKSGPWSGPFKLEMWRKTVIRRLSKRLPMSTDLERVVKRDDEMYDLDKVKEVTEEKTIVDPMNRLESAVGATEVDPALEKEVESTEAEEPPMPNGEDEIPL
jgi:recombination protein RecT